MGLEDTAKSKATAAVNGLIGKASGMLGSIFGAFGAAGPAPSLAPTPIEGPIVEPKPTDDKAEYGKIQIRENKGGFVEKWDETPGNVRKIEQHPTGTYDAMLDNGDHMNKVTHKKITIVDDNWEIIVYKDEIKIIQDNNRIEIRKDSYYNIHGNQNINIDGVNSEKVHMDCKEEYMSNHTTKVGINRGIAIGCNNTETIGGNCSESTGGNHSEMVGGHWRVSVAGNISITSGLNINSMAAIIHRIGAGHKVIIG